jgi:hypothetical protein
VSTRRCLTFMREVVWEVFRKNEERVKRPSLHFGFCWLALQGSLIGLRAEVGTPLSKL